MQTDNMSILKLTENLENFIWTNHEGAGLNHSQISGRHGGTVGPTPAQPPHPDDHSEFDNGVGFGVAPSDNPQSFDVRGYTVTGNKRFYIGWQGDIMNHPLSDYGIGAFDTISKVFDGIYIICRVFHVRESTRNEEKSKISYNN